eukprot:5323748-Pyramimonas_sp.AAC.1
MINAMVADPSVQRWRSFQGAAGKLVAPVAEDEAGEDEDPDTSKKDEEEKAFWDTIKAKGWTVNTSAGNPAGGRWARAIAKT